MSGVIKSARTIMFRDMLPGLRRDGSVTDDGEPAGMLSKAQTNLLSNYLDAEDAGIGLLTLDILNFHRIVLFRGDEASYGLFNRLVEDAERLFMEYYPKCRILFAAHWGLGQTVFFFEHPKYSPYQLARAYSMMRMAFEEMLKKEASPDMEEQLEAVMGYGELNPARRKDIPRAIIKGLCEARQFSSGSLDSKTMELQKEFMALIEEGAIVPVYQPVLDFSKGETMGWEAFSRGPADSSFAAPSTFFRFAEYIGGVYELDQRCREMALANLGTIEKDQMIFINTHPMSLSNGRFGPKSFGNLLARHNLNPKNVVLEFSQKLHVTSSSQLRQALKPYREAGFRVAVDDMAGGRSSLTLLSQVQPDFIKLDVSIVRGVDSDPFKRLIVETLAYMSKLLRARLIAVGLESETEFSALVSMGVQAGQGFLLSGPEAVKKEATIQTPTVGSFQEVRDISWKCSKPVVEMVEMPMTAPPDTTIEEIQTLLKDKPPTSNVVIVDGLKPIGQLMSYNLDRRLGQRYGISLYLQREVTHLMNRGPLIVDSDQSVEEVAKLAMQRRGPEIYDDIIVTRNNELVGTVSVQRLLDYLAQFQVELAKGTNPLTGLPGNLAIEHELERRIKHQIASSLMYVDLDNFKVYNDVYGFSKGDQVILMTAQVLGDAINKAGDYRDFLGHVGGDDFIIISTYDRADAIGEAIVKRFAEEAPKYYNEEHRRTGSMIAVGRDGIRREFGFVSVSIGIIDFEFHRSFTLSELSERAAEIKKFAKSKWGNSCVRDRRCPLGAAE
ncbi:MAG: EAL and GGDEF domain-containing protein [Deltaproteobacteria bacterium]|nr:EAL and GGDEF domain-containing protein [Deltaproteobacteria bacterium]